MHGTAELGHGRVRRVRTRGGLGIDRGGVRAHVIERVVVLISGAPRRLVELIE